MIYIKPETCIDIKRIQFKSIIDLTEPFWDIIFHVLRYMFETRPRGKSLPETMGCVW